MKLVDLVGDVLDHLVENLCAMRHAADASDETPAGSYSSRCWSAPPVLVTGAIVASQGKARSVRLEAASLTATPIWKVPIGADPTSVPGHLPAFALSPPDAKFVGLNIGDFATR